MITYIKEHGVYFVVLILFTICVLLFGFNESNKAKLEEKNQLIISLHDTLHSKVLDNGQVEFYKKTIQAQLKQLENKDLVLSDSQKQLLDFVKSNNQNNSLIAGAIIQMGIALQNLKNENATQVNDSTINFSSLYNDTTFKYSMDVNNVLRYKNFKPSLNIKDIEFPNKQYIKFNFDKEKGNPVSFSVTNTNPYMKTYDIASYIIPEIQKSSVKPNLWQKITHDRIHLGVGVGLGYNPFDSKIYPTVQFGTYYKIR